MQLTISQEDVSCQEIFWRILSSKKAHRGQLLGVLTLLSLLFCCIGANVPFLFGSIGRWEKNRNAAASEKLSPSQARQKGIPLGFSDAGDKQDGQNPEQLINQDGQGAKLTESGTAGKESNQHKT